MLDAVRAGILTALLVSCLACGCLTEGLIEARVARYDASNERNRAEALRSYLAAHRLTEVAAANRGSVGYVPDPSGGPAIVPQTSLAVVARAPAQELGPNEWILRSPDDAKGSPRLVFASAVCVSGDSCGCGRTMGYAFATAADGGLWVIRLRPRIDEHRVKRFGTCSSGCGQPSPPPEPVGYDLPASDAGKVKIVEVSYDMDKLEVSCFSEMPAP